MDFPLPPVWIFRSGLVGALFFGACLFRVLFRWEKAQESIRKRGGKPSRGSAILAGVCMVGVGIGLAWLGYANIPPSPPDRIASMADAKQYVVGTWVYADQLDANNPYVTTWVKWVIHEDGTIDAYYASPRADSWGSPVHVHGDIITDKFADSGERFYAVKVAQTSELAFLGRLGLAYTIAGRGGVLMQRGDRNPFTP